MGKTENVNQIFRDKNYESTLTNKTQTNTIQNFQQKNLIKKDQLKKRLFTTFIISQQRNPKFTKSQTNGKSYFNKEKIFNYVSFFVGTIMIEFFIYLPKQRFQN